MRALLLIGPPGAGKTTTLTALTGLLEAEDVAHAAFEVEALATAHPWPAAEAVVAHVRSLADSFRRQGYPLLLVAATVEDGGHLGRLLDALAVEDALVVRLTAQEHILRERVAQREPPDWVGLPRLLEAVAGLEAAMAALEGVGMVIDTEATGPRTAAAAIRARLGTAR